MFTHSYKYDIPPNDKIGSNMSLFQLTLLNCRTFFEKHINEINDLYGELSLDYSNATVDQMVGFMCEKVYRQRHSVYFAMDGDKLVGTITLFPETKLYGNGKRVLHLEDLVVFPEYRGKGVATELILLAKQVMKNENCSYIVLRCSNSLESFYKKNGFKTSGESMKFS